MGFRPHGKSPIYRHPTRASGRGSYLKPFTNIRPERLQEIRDLLNIPGANQFEELVPDQGNIAGATREDISSYLFNLPDMSGFNAAIMLAYLCRYVNERHSPGPGHPICVAQSVIQWNFIALGRTLEVSYALKKAGVTPENFFNISHVFYLIQIQSDPSDINPFTSKTRDDHCALLVISPLSKTVEYLDSSYHPSRRSGAEARAFSLVFNFLAAYLGRAFIWPDWSMQRNRAPIQPQPQPPNPDNADCVIMALTNAMCIAFGYPLSYTYTQMGPRRERAASELLHGGFDRYEGEDDDCNGEFAYQFGDYDDRTGFEDLDPELPLTFKPSTRINRGAYRDATEKTELRSHVLAIDARLAKLHRIQPISDAVFTWMQVEKHTVESCILLVELLDDLLLRNAHDKASLAAEMAVFAAEALTRTERTFLQWLDDPPMRRPSPPASPTGPPRPPTPISCPTSAKGEGRSPKMGDQPAVRYPRTKAVFNEEATARAKAAKAKRDEVMRRRGSYVMVPLSSKSRSPKGKSPISLKRPKRKNVVGEKETEPLDPRSGKAPKSWSTKYTVSAKGKGEKLKLDPVPARRGSKGKSTSPKSLAKPKSPLSPKGDGVKKRGLGRPRKVRE